MNIYIVCRNDFPYEAFKDAISAKDRCTVLREQERHNRETFMGNYPRIYYHIQEVELK